MERGKGKTSDLTTGSTGTLLSGKTCAQSEQAISILPARVPRDSGYRAIPGTQKNASLRPYPASRKLSSRYGAV